MTPRSSTRTSPGGMAVAFGVEAFPLAGRKRRSAWLHPVSRVAMEVRSAGDEHAEIARHPLVSSNGDRIMVRVIYLDSIQPGIAKRGNPRIDCAAARMRKGRESAGTVHDGDDVFGDSASPFDERGASAPEPQVERL